MRFGAREPRRNLGQPCRRQSVLFCHSCHPHHRIFQKEPEIQINESIGEYEPHIGHENGIEIQLFKLIDDYDCDRRIGEETDFSFPEDRVNKRKGAEKAKSYAGCIGRGESHYAAFRSSIFATVLHIER